nr:hypothetical protein [uncultured Oscillibacter sp.]
MAYHIISEIVDRTYGLGGKGGEERLRTSAHAGAAESAETFCPLFENAGKICRDNFPIGCYN